MAKSATAQKARAPQGAKRVAQAFLNELGTIAEDKQADVGKAAQAMIREALIARREKAKSAKAKSRASTAPESGRGARGRRKARTSSARKATRPRLGGSSQSESGEEQNGTLGRVVI
jgi:hypothetical protein